MAGDHDLVAGEEEDEEDDEELDEGQEDDIENGDDDDEDIEADPMAHLPPYVVKRVEKLKQLHEEREELMAKYLKERAALEKKYEAMLVPLYHDRRLIVAGERDDEIAKEDIAVGDGIEGAVDPEQQGAAGDEGKISGIPQFWACAMTQMETTGDLITEEDVDCLEHLRDIRCVDRDDGLGFTLYFHFAPNEYFENEILTKEYEIPNLLLSDEPIIKAVKGTEIKWFANRSLTYRMVKKKQRGKGKNKGQVRTITKKESKDSFFNWFKPPTIPAMDMMDEVEAERLEEEFDEDYEVADAFRTKIIPQAVMWFTGKANEREMERAIDGVVDGLPD